MNSRDTELMELALGLTGRREREALELEIERSAELREAFLEVQGLVPKLALSESPLAPPPELKARLLASTREETRFEAFVDRLCEMLDLGSARVRSLLDEVDTVPGPPWVQGLTPGNHLFDFDAGPSLSDTDWPDAHCGIVRLESGERFPRHRHSGTEHTFVIAGDLEDEQNCLLPGDEIVYEVGSVHELRSSGDEALVFVVVLRGGFEILDQ